MKILVKILTVWIALAGTANSAMAYDFETWKDGKCIYYNIISSYMVAVTYADEQLNSYSGNIVIPKSVI
jgi:hypothetical protein